MTNTNPANPTPCSVVELRRYTLQPGTRETLIGLFDREFVETQEAVGSAVLGQFRDLDDPDAFVWLRGFRDMRRRQEALAAFYGGPVWYRHRDAANATMIDSDDVLLLRPTSPLAWSSAERGSKNATAVPPEEIAVTVYYVGPGLGDSFADEVRGLDAPSSTALYFVTEPSENTFPALPVREGEEVCVVVDARVGPDRELPLSLQGRFARPPESFRLQPTARSLIPGRHVRHIGEGRLSALGPYGA